MGLLDLKFVPAIRRVVIVTSPCTKELEYAFEERAAIAEFDGGLSRTEAEAQARAELNPSRDDPPAGER